MKHELEEFRKELEEFKNQRNDHDTMHISTNNADDTVKNEEYQNSKKKQQMIIKSLKV